MKRKIYVSLLLGIFTATGISHSMGSLKARIMATSIRIYQASQRCIKPSTTPGRHQRVTRTAIPALSRRNLKLLGVASVIATSLPLATNNAPKPAAEVDLFSQLSNEAEKQYQQSKSDGQHATTAQPQELTVAQEVKKEAEEPKTNALPKPVSSEINEGKPILAQHKQFSDDWWEKLFADCKGCSDRNATIDCDKMLADNPQWKEVVEMSPRAKQLIMQRALKRFEKKGDACNLACAVCAGGDPNEHTDINNGNIHSPLHLAASYFNEYGSHYGVFKLLLEKGADANRKCKPCNSCGVCGSHWDGWDSYPWNFARQWREDLKKHGGKPPVD